jgi:D-sedoheptulose 7-phosphate isomerase
MDTKFIAERLLESASVKKKISEDEKLLAGVRKAADAIIKCYREGGKTLFFGNGGSASDAQHLACELVSKYKLERDGIPAIALTTDTSILTAVPNDYDFDMVFYRQILALGKKGDVAFGISTSGNSPNVLKAVELAREKGMITIGLSGSGGKLRDMVDIPIAVPSDDTPVIQESHITIGHIICHIVEHEIFG